MAILQNFFDTVVWYGTPFVREFIDNHAEDLRADCSKDIWEKKGLGFKSTAHFAVLENDYQYLLAFVTYRFAELREVIRFTHINFGTARAYLNHARNSSPNIVMENRKNHKHFNRFVRGKMKSLCSLKDFI